MKVITKDIKKLTFDEACKYYNKDLSLKKGIKIMYIQSVKSLFPSEITIPDAKEIIGYFSGEENMYGHCIYYR